MVEVPGLPDTKAYYNITLCEMVWCRQIVKCNALTSRIKASIYGHLTYDKTSIVEQ